MTRRYAADGKVVYKIEEALVLPCGFCHAPMVSPFPASWFLQFRCDGPAEDSRNQLWLTPHVPGCTARMGQR
jgi:hypothetical protein